VPEPMPDLTPGAMSGVTPGATPGAMSGVDITRPAPTRPPRARPPRSRPPRAVPDPPDRACRLPGHPDDTAPTAELQRRTTP
jgi:hypothetical protein